MAMGSDNGETTRWRRKFLRRRRWCKPLPLSLFLLLTVVSLHFSGLVTRRIPMYLQDSPPSATSAIRKTAMSLWASHYLKGRRTTKSRQRRNNSTTLTIVVTGDVHGHHQARRLSALLKKLRRQHNASENEFLVLLDAGDATFPGNETLVANIMNRLGYHASKFILCFPPPGDMLLTVFPLSGSGRRES